MRDRLPIAVTGFTTRFQLVELLSTLGADALAELLETTPAIVADMDEGRRTSARAVGVTRCGGDEPTQSRPGTFDGAAAEVGFLLKAPGAPFPGLITVGRAKACDLQLRLPTVSKIHAYFVRDEDRWFVVDQQSMNKTRHNGQPLPPNQQQPLVEGDTVRFGLEHTYTLMFPARLIAWLSQSVTVAPRYD